MINFKLKKNIQLLVKYEFKRVFFKSIFINTSLPTFLRFKAYKILTQLNRRTSLSYLRLRCLYTQRSRFLLPTFKTSRMCFKALYSYGFLNGLRKSSS